jgi:cytochrome c
MKKFIGVGCFLILVSCTTNTNKKDIKQLTTIDEVPKGFQLINTYDCLACHKIDQKLTGPAYIEIATKYSNTKENVNLLAQKIIKGSQGVWGAMVMLPHPQISEDEAKEMASYILRLRQ